MSRIASNQGKRQCTMCTHNPLFLFLYLQTLSIYAQISPHDGQTKTGRRAQSPFQNGWYG